MTERGLPSMDGAPACPFVAFEDDRDGRASSPDHRHRCFAESPPAPRALAHQEAYCLSSAFPVCPTFQEWARREAAHARANDAAAAVPGAAMGAAGDAATAGAWGEPSEESRGPVQPTPVEEPRRNPPRDWAAPPPWATPAGAGGRPPGSTPPADELLAGKGIEGRGLAGSAADQLAGGPPPAPRSAGTSAWSASAGTAASAADEDLAGLVGGRPTPASASPDRDAAAAGAAGAAAAGATGATGAAASSQSGSSSRRPTVSSTRPSGPSGPSWEQPRRYEAYPTIKTRASLPGLPRLGLLAGALIIAAIALFMLPALLGIGGPGSSPSPHGPSQAAPSVSTEPTAPPAPTPTVYIVKTGDTMSKIARKFGVSLDDLIAANKDNIKNPDKLKVGDEVIIPLAQPSAAASPAASASAAP